jgi:hypothetical protein
MIELEEPLCPNSYGTLNTFLKRFVLKDTVTVDVISQTFQTVQITWPFNVPDRF